MGMGLPGSSKIERIKENLGVADVFLTKEEFDQIESQLVKARE
ncbi:hypothetical protein [Peribacillus simplex]|nr:hypothetical protein [Peribacillus simplex]